jgi:excisionase family DNA binding protein
MLEGLLNNINNKEEEDKFELLTKEQVQEWLQISKSKCEKMMKEVKYYKVGRIVRFNKYDVIEFIKTHEVN